MKNTYTVIKSLIVCFALTQLLACGGGGNGGSTEIPADATASISGVAKFERVPITSTGLSYNGIVEVPIRRAVVKLIDSKGSVVSSSTTDNNGAYNFKTANNTKYKVRVYSETLLPKMAVQDNFAPDSTTGENAVYAIESQEVTTGAGNTSLDLLAKSGWSLTQNRYASTRQSAPFAILDSCLKAALFFDGQDLANFARLRANWSTKNSYNTISTSHWTGEMLNILGDEDVDTDEFDEHVIVHEWGHYFEAKLGRTDSLGGPHTDGDILEPSVAFSEGWGNALSAMVLFPDTVYKDSAGFAQSDAGITFDVERNKEELQIDPSFKVGWFSENTVQQIIFDLFDEFNADESFDQVSSTSDVIFKIFNEKIKNANSLTTIFTFLNGFKELQPSSTDAVNTLLAEHQMGPIVDEFGTGESNNGGLTGILPLYKDLAVGGSVNLQFDNYVQDNLLAGFRYLKISGVSGNVTVSVSGATSLNCYVEIFEKGVVIAGKNGFGTLNVNANLDASKTYIVRVSGFSSANSVTATLTK